MPTPETITFEGLAPVNDEASVPHSYAGLHWNHVFVVDKDFYAGDPDGYEAVVHGRGVAAASIKGHFSSNGFEFSLKSGHFGAAWNTGLLVTFKAFDHGVLTGVQHITLDQVDTFIHLSDAFRHITKVVILTSGGEEGTGSGGGEHVAFDNLNVILFNGSPAATHPHDADHTAIADMLQTHDAMHTGMNDCFC